MATPKLDTIPTELRLIIYSHLDPRDHCRMGLSCRLFCQELRLEMINALDNEVDRLAANLDPEWSVERTRVSQDVLLVALNFPEWYMVDDLCPPSNFLSALEGFLTLKDIYLALVPYPDSDSLEHDSITAYDNFLRLYARKWAARFTCLLSPSICASHNYSKATTTIDNGTTRIRAAVIELNMSAVEASLLENLESHSFPGMHDSHDLGAQWDNEDEHSLRSRGWDLNFTVTKIRFAGDQHAYTTRVTWTKMREDADNGPVRLPQCRTWTELNPCFIHPNTCDCKPEFWIRTLEAHERAVKAALKRRTCPWR